MQQLFTGILKKLAFFLLVLPGLANSQEGITLREYIETYKYIAIQEMREAGIPASIKLAQAILESGFGNSELAVNANNHFGIKCHGWPGMTYYYDDDEPQECFRKYTDPIQSFLDHSEFLLTRPWYAPLFDLPVTDYKAWAHGLKEAGYATNPRYAQLLIRLIEEHQLYLFDQKALDEHFVLANQYQREEYSPVTTHAAGQTGTRTISSFNRINYVIAKDGDTVQSIARELDMRPRQIISYNDFENNHQLEAGQRVFIQPKRRRGEVRYHIAKPGDTMFRISQEYGIRMENLYRRNDMRYGMEPEPGQKILLRGYEGSFIDYFWRRP